MTAPIVLRAVAVLIAVVGAIDPAWTRMAPIEHPISVRIIDSPTLHMTAPISRRVAALAAAERVRAGLSEHTDVRVVSSSRASICPGIGICLVIGDGPVSRPMTSGAVVAGAVDVSTPVSPNVAIAGIESPARAPLAGASMLRVQLRGVGMRGTSRIDVEDDQVVVGSATHDWSDGATDVVTDVSWIPVAPGLRRLAVSVESSETEQESLDNIGDVGVEVNAESWPILIDEPEVTWTGTFLRRALEADARFAVRSRARLAPGLTMSRGGPLTDEALEAARAVVATAPDSLSVAEVDLLERYVRQRGGSLVLPLDRRPGGPIGRLVPPVLEERRDAEPHRIGSLLASEVVTFRSGPGIVVLESLEGRPVIVARAMGRGRVIVSGALDAWRYRGGDRFARFWTSVVADAALAAPPAIDVQLASALVVPHQEVPFTVSRHSLSPLEGEVTARAVMRCGETHETVRLWPAAQPGHFSGVVTAPASGGCDIEASIDGIDARRASARVTVGDGLHLLTPGPATLASAIAAHGAPVVSAGHESELVARVRERLPRDQAPRDTYPMRSPWWLVPFVGCLSGEWWLRRRRGLR
jgi:hypothetical protein